MDDRSVRRLRRPAAVLTILVGVLVLLGSLAYWRFSQAVANPDAVTLPESLAGLPLASAAYGPQAVAEVNRLHRKEFPLTSGAMGMYGSDAAEATLWVTGVPLDAMAAQTVAAMHDKIAEGNSPFRPTGEREAGRRTVYELDGMGQKHFYFQAGALVIWLAADADIAEQALAQALVVYP